MRYEKVSGALLIVHDDYLEEGVVGLNRHVRMLGLADVDETQRPPRTIVFLLCDEGASFAHLVERGVHVNQDAGSVRTAILPLDALDALSENPSVERIVPSRNLRPLLDVASPASNVPAFRTNQNLSGRDVIVGIIDTGIDAVHPSFAGRVLRIWDQTIPGAGIAGTRFSYGLELAGPGLTTSRDQNGHGTHVAGIAVGSGAPFEGIAPDADLVIVKTDFQNTHIADAVQYVFRVALALNRPAVVNLSLGGHFDAHDGSDPLSRVIDGASGPGRIVCCAAGNEGSDNIRARIEVPPGATRSARFRVPATSIGNAMLNGWYAGAGNLEIWIETPNGYVTSPQGVITVGSPTRRYPLPDADVRIATTPPTPANGDHQFVCDLRGFTPAAFVQGGTWRLHVRNLGAQPLGVDVWALDDRDSPQVLFSGASVRDDTKIGSPGCAREAITVASFTTKNRWTDSTGAVQNVGLRQNDLSDFSSSGPLRNGARKPDFAAPGAMLVSAMSQFSAPRTAEIVDQHHVVMAGTSMAAPFVTGVVALMLQQNPQLDPANAKAWLQQRATIPGAAPGSFDPRWGYGFLRL